MPMPPETGKSGSGVIIRIAAPTWISARAVQSGITCGEGRKRNREAS